MCDLRYFRAIYADFKLAKKVFCAFTNDERTVNSTVYNLQQCVEKLLKAYLECAGVNPPHSHDISRLIRASKENASCVEITEWIDDYAETLTYWEANSRYNLDFFVEVHKVERALNQTEKFLAINGLQEDLFSQITDEVKELIKSRIPEDKIPVENWEWNVLYKIFQKQFSS